MKCNWRVPSIDHPERLCGEPATSYYHYVGDLNISPLMYRCERHAMRPFSNFWPISEQEALDLAVLVEIQES